MVDQRHNAIVGSEQPFSLRFGPMLLGLILIPPLVRLDLRNFFRNPFEQAVQIEEHFFVHSRKQLPPLPCFISPGLKILSFILST